MARSPHNSPLVRVAWSDAVSGTRRSTFKRNDPLELRFGLEFEPGFWTSFESSTLFFLVHTFRFGNLAKRLQLTLTTLDLPGAPAPQLGLGMRLARARQAQIDANVGGSLTFRGEFWFTRFGGTSQGLSQWAMAPDDHAFLLEPFDNEFPEGVESLTLVGGAGTPPGTPPP